MKKVKYKSKYKDFSCDCGCDQKLRIVKDTLGKLTLLDIGILQGKEKRPKVGIVLRSDGKLKEFKKFIT